jgi:hypothetical protein
MGDFKIVDEILEDIEEKKPKNELINTIKTLLKNYLNLLCNLNICQ